MKNRPNLSFSFILFLATACTVFSAITSNARSSSTGSVQQAIDRVTPALVKIHTLSTSYQQGREIKYESTGSGTIISPDGYIVTNHHVVGHAIRLRCTLLNNEELDADLVGTDALSDIAIIRLKTESNRTFPFASFGDSAQVVVGEKIIAMGSPISLSQSVTFGVVSNIGMTIPKEYRRNQYTFRLDGEDVGSFVLWIGHDAAIYPGNSGGPLVNLKGEIVGINEIVFGLSGAIPSNLAKEIAFQLKKNGSVTRSYLGIEVQPLFKQTNLQTGVIVSSVESGSPAAAAGFQPGDCLTELARHPITVQYYEEMPLFHQRTATLPIGKPIPATIVRTGKEKHLTIIPTKRQPAQPETIESKPWGITIRNISTETRKQLKLKDRMGVLVTSVRPGGPSGLAKPDVRPKDIIKKINDVAIMDIDHFQSLTRDITKNHDKPVPTLIEAKRDAQLIISVVKVGIQKKKDQGVEVRKAWIPIQTQVITRDIARIYGNPQLTGVRVTRLLDKDFCKNSNIFIGDFIVSLDGMEIPAAFPQDQELFASLIRQYPIGATVKLDLIRNQKNFSVTLKLPQRPDPQQEMDKYQDVDFEFVVRNLSFMKKNDMQWPQNQQGVIVEEVSPGSWAALGELAVDDLVIEVAGQPVADVRQFEEIMTGLSSSKPKMILFHIIRSTHHKFLQIESAWPAGKP